ncbi:5718_t:CDS:2 [Ambispora leptoticha]|uniref:DNA polymerase delta subunit 3 n=1 Tax=Ambispora leptoticha TaxID=144679 RepID=A0A9N8ZDE8_9GLOM|nr:5718_t:CDS:2 [Ambispora leptoticha]
MSSFDNYLQVLKSLIFEEERVVSYKCLGQHLGVHLNIAKQILLEFANTQSASEKGVRTTFYLSGITQDNQSLVTIVPQEELESTKSAFKSLSSVHVHSIQNSSSVVPTNREFRRLTANDPITIKPIIINKNITVKESPKKNITEPSRSINATTSATTKQQSSTQSKIQNKSNSQRQAQHAENSPMSISSSSSKTSNGKKSLSIKKVNGKTSSKINANTTKIAPRTTGKRSKQSVDDSKRAGRMPPKKRIIVEISEQHITTPQEPTQNRRRAKRKVAKHITSTNSRGYDVVENVYEWESYSDDDLEKPQPTYIPKSQITTKLQQQQSEKHHIENTEKPKKNSKKKNNVIPGQSKLSAFWK